MSQSLLSPLGFPARGAQNCAKPGRKPRQGPRKREPRRPAPGGSCVSRSCCAARFTTPARRASEGVGPGLPPSLARRVGVVAVAAERGAAPALTALAAAPLGCADEGAKGLPNQPEKTIGRLMQVQDETITSVAARVSGSGCAKMRKTGRNPATPRKREQRRLRVDLSRRGRNRGCCWLGARRPDFRGEPENTIGRLMQGQDESPTSVAARVSGSGCANLAKPGATPASAAPTGARAVAAVTARASRNRGRGRAITGISPKPQPPSPVLRGGRGRMDRIIPM